MRRLPLIILAACAGLLVGCYTTTTKMQLLAQVRHLRTNAPQGQMIHEGSDDKYDYYRFEPGGERYRVARNPTGA